MKKHAPRRYDDCTILRCKVVETGTMNLTTSEITMDRRDVEIGPCNVPLFANSERATGVCRACQCGWEGPTNRFANDLQARIAANARFRHDALAPPPAHGTERNHGITRDPRGEPTTYVDTITGKPLVVVQGSVTQTTCEKYCASCGAWFPVVGVIGALEWMAAHDGEHAKWVEA